jgi:hypothetical protein
MSQILLSNNCPHFRNDHSDGRAQCWWSRLRATVFCHCQLRRKHPGLCVGQSEGVAPIPQTAREMGAALGPGWAEKPGFERGKAGVGCYGNHALCRACLGRKGPVVAKSSVAGMLARIQPAHGWAGVPGAARPWSAGLQGDASPCADSTRRHAFVSGFQGWKTPAGGGPPG